MNILYAGTVDLDRAKGDAVHFTHLAQALHARGHALTVVAYGSSRPTGFPNVPFTPVPRTFLPKIGTFVNDFRLLNALTRVARSTRFDLIYHRGVPLANIWAHLRGIPAVTEVNGIQADELKAVGMSRLGLRWYRRRERKIVGGADRVICVTSGIREQLVAHYGVPRKRCVVIGNAADIQLFMPRLKDTCRRRVGLPLLPFHIGFVGTFQPWVDFDVLLRAVQMVIDQDLPLHCTLVGDGPLYSEVVQKGASAGLADYMTLPGRVSHQDVPYWIGAFDVCVAPFVVVRNKQIGLSPLKIFEYLACGRPVVATNLPGIAKTLMDSGAGLLYPPGDARRLADQLVALYRSPEKVESLGLRGRSYVVAHHSWTRVAEETERVMLGVMTR